MTMGSPVVQAPQFQQPPNPPLVIDKLDGLRNTVDLERLQPSELSIAKNVDIDDRGEGHRRRGQQQVISSPVHSLFNTNGGKVYGVVNNALGRINPDYSFDSIVSDIALNPLAYVQVGPNLYYTSERNAGIIDLRTLTASGWGDAPGNGFWFSPVVHPHTPALAGPGTPNPNPSPLGPDRLLPPINGRLFGNPPLATALTWFNGRIYLAQKRLLWATELTLYNYVDKTKNFRHYEEDITALGRVEDGIYVGTAAKLYFVSGRFGEEQRVPVYDSPITPGSATQVSGDMIIPIARLRPEIPEEAHLCVFMRSQAGLLACFREGRVFNLTRTSYLFPEAATAATLFRVQDGMNTVVMSQNSQGTPATSAARFSDHFDVELIRAIDRPETGDS